MTGNLISFLKISFNVGGESEWNEEESGYNCERIRASKKWRSKYGYKNKEQKAEASTEDSDMNEDRKKRENGNY